MRVVKVFVLIVIGIIAIQCSSDDTTATEPVLADFSLNHPPNNEANNSADIQFKWERSTHAVRYALHIGENAQVNDQIFTDITGTEKRVGNLQYGTTYFWKVIAYDREGNSLSSPTYTFHTKKNYSVLDANFYMPQLDRYRKISIYLPPNYENESLQYPVLYMHDGQAIFDTENYPYEEWEVDDTLDRLYQEIGFNLIVVGIDYNDQGYERLNEYSPWVNTGQIYPPIDGYGGLGDEYIDFIVEVLKPHVDANYRTMRDKEHTGILGSSMGGLISCYAGLEYPDVFGKIGVYSPSLWFSEGGVYDLASANSHLLGDSKFYFLAGDSESITIDLPQDIQEMIDIFTQSGMNQDNFTERIVPGGTHEEYLWREGFEETIRWLFIN